MDDNNSSSSPPAPPSPNTTKITKDVVTPVVCPTNNQQGNATMTKEIIRNNKPAERLSRQQSHIPRLQRSSSLRLKKSESSFENVSNATEVNGNNNNNNNNDNKNNKNNVTRFNNNSLRRSHSFSSSMDRRTHSKENGGSNHHHHHHNDFQRLGRSSSELEDDDGSSVKSFASSNNSLASCDLGSTISGRRSSASVSGKKYILHCQRPIPQTDEKYLTPTQRKDRQIRQLKAALVRATRGCEEKSVEVERLKAEVERLRFSYSVVSGHGSQICDSPLPVTTEDSSRVPEETIDEQTLKFGLDSIDETDARDEGIQSPDEKIRNSNSLEDSGILNDLMDNDGRPVSGSSLLEVVSSSTEEERVNNVASGLSNRSESTSHRDRRHVIEKSESSTERMDLQDNVHNCRETQTEDKVVDDATSPTFYDSEREFHSYKESEYLPNLSCGASPSVASNRNLNEVPNNLWHSLENIRRNHALECQEMKEKHNNKVEDLLQKLSELNSRYFEVRSAYEKSLERIRVLDTQVSELRKEMSCQEEWHSQMYLKMYRKGQEAAKFEHADEVLEFAHKAPKRVSVPELLQRVYRAENDLEHMKQLCEMYRRKQPTSQPEPMYSASSSSSSANSLHYHQQHHHQHGGDRAAEYTLKFLKDAVYYYLTEKDNKGHLQAIQSILGFNETERKAVAKAIRKNIRLV